MKRLVLKKKAKILFTCLIILASMFIYSKVDILGQLAQNSLFYQFMCLGSWFWLVAGQIQLLTLIWEER